MQVQRDISVVVPAYNEQEVLAEFHRRLAAVMATLGMSWEVVYVNDGSTDATLSVLHRLREDDAHAAVINLSRNFGKEIALTAGLDHATGAATVVIDADLQDPPELIPEFVRQWKQGADVVYARRVARDGETFLKKLTARLFYRVAGRLGRVTIPSDTGDFRLLGRRALDELLRLREQHRFMKGLFVWVGFRQVAVEYRRDPRYAGHTKWNYWRLWNFALEGVTSFSTAPLRLASYVGALVALWAFGFAVWVVIKTLVFGDPVAGYPTIMVAMLFLGSVQLMALGIIGEYLGRMFDESKNRPLYVLESYLPAQASTSAPLSASARSGA